MADRVSVAIAIGGTLAASSLSDFFAAIQSDGLSTERDGPAFTPDQFVEEEVLHLFAHGVAWGALPTLEAFCSLHGLSWRRWSGGSTGSFNASRTVHRGRHGSANALDDTQDFDATEDDEIVMTEALARSLGSFEAIIAEFERADYMVPPLTIDRTARSTRP